MQVVRQQYMLLGHLVSNSSGVVMEPHIITMTIDSDAFPDFQRKGLGFLYMLAGAVGLASTRQEGLFAEAWRQSSFDADTPHGPDNHCQTTCEVPLVISCLDG